MRGEILFVPSQYGTIQAAIDQSSNNDIIMVSPGIYYENINFLGKAITVRTMDPNDPNIVAATIIDGSQPDNPEIGSVVTFNSGEGNKSVLMGFTIQGGTGSWVVVAWEYQGRRWNRCGGGVVCYNMAEPTITKNVFRNNLAGQGGGIYIYGDPGNPANPDDPANPAVHIRPIISHNQFLNNSAITAHGFAPPNDLYPANDHGDGGAIVGFQGVDATIAGNEIRNCHADAYGGAIHLRQWSHGLITENHVHHNNALLGGGIHITYTSSPRILNNTIQKNKTGGLGGGGIYIYFFSNPYIERNIIENNYGSNGAGIAIIWDSNPKIWNNLIVGNMNGAGIMIKSNSAPQIICNTITDGLNARGIEFYKGVAPVIEHNIITSYDNFGIYAYSTHLATVRYNNVWGNKLGNYGGTLNDLTGSNGNISFDPNFGVPGYWDPNDTPDTISDDFWVSGNYHLRPESPCINAGNNLLLPAGLIADIDDDVRPQSGMIPSTAIVDMGADEYVPGPLADIDFNGLVDINDFLLIINHWLNDETEINADLNKDGITNMGDFYEISFWWLWSAQWY